MGEEKRKKPRLNTVCPCILKGHSGEYHGLLRNISVGGVSMELHDNLGEKDNYELEFILIEGPRIRVLSRIAWSMPQGSAQIYGFEFLDLGLFKRIKLNSYIVKHLKKQQQKRNVTA
ncbi:MAG: PilZ domain-containing protein [Elusimicrobiota bacterium]